MIKSLKLKFYFDHYSIITRIERIPPLLSFELKDKKRPIIQDRYQTKTKAELEARRDKARRDQIVQPKAKTDGLETEQSSF